MTADSIAKGRSARGTPGRRALAAKLGRALARPDRVAFVDVETTGLSRYYHRPTLVGVMVAGNAHCWLAGDPPETLGRMLAEAITLVTFNGTLFDVGFLRMIDPGLVLPDDHVDLRYAVRQVGLSGGQKRIEKELGINRGALDGADGGGAVSLWHRYARGDIGALRTLIDYNRADLDGMRAILDHVVTGLGLAEADLFVPPSFVALPTAPRSWARPDVSLPMAETRGLRPLSRLELFGDRLDDLRIVGLDLTGSGARPSGYALLQGSAVETVRLGEDDEILARIRADRPVLVSIDSPLCMPRGRTSVFDDDPMRAQHGIMRQCERTLKRRGINVYPCLLPSMQRLTARGMSLAACLRSEGVPVIESYPGAAQDIIGLPRKQNGLDHLTSSLRDFGLDGAFGDSLVSHDELDAITCALVGAFFLERLYEPLGGEEEDPLIVPSLERRPTRRIVGVSGRIAAGKTTLAEMLRETGFAYARYSEVVADEVRRRGGLPDRASMQEVGWEISRDRGQRWLGARLIERLGDADHCVVDGLRFPDDHAYLFEQAGLGFTHVHVGAAFPVRRERYERLAGHPVEFEAVDSQPVEMRIGELEHVADLVIENEADLAALRAVAASL